MSLRDHLPGQTTASWDVEAADASIRDLWALREVMLANEAHFRASLNDVAAARRASAVNLIHYLAMRQLDLRPLQERLARVGVSSLGRAETHVLANVDKVLGILHLIAGLPWSPLSRDEPAGFIRGASLLGESATDLFGPAPDGRGVRMMVTLPSEAAHDPALVAGLVDAGMDVARINCAHDESAHWVAMAVAVRQAARKAGRQVRVLMDLAGPKLRTAPLADGPRVIRIRPRRDALGRVIVAAHLGLRPHDASLAIAGAAQSLGVDAAWLAALRVDDRIDVTDARGARRHLKVVERSDLGVIVACDHTLYLTPETSLRRHRRARAPRDTQLSQISALPGELLLSRGDRLDLVAGGRGCQTRAQARFCCASIGCTLPEALAQVRKGQRIWFDDGRIGGVVRRCSVRRLQVEITDAREGGEKLGADKGINLPDTDLDLPALTEQDLRDLATVAEHADIVGLSFAQSAADIRQLQDQLCQRGAGQLGLIVKIETRRGFENLPALLLAAMAGPATGVMIARGDLAVECGYERLAEVQEEILWAAEAAHMPVVWATQVLETLAKTGQPSRAEVTDAAMGERAECVMLNKGPHIVEAMHTLDDILRRMQTHQAKKRSLLRALQAWS